jgi:hypothetical protein
MSSVFSKSRWCISVLLIALLIGVQTISITHAYEHDPEAAQGTACAACVSINQLGAAVIDNGQAMSPCGFKSLFRNDHATPNAIVDLVAPRERGPPAAL